MAGPQPVKPAAPKAAPKRKRALRISIRLKILTVFSVVSMLAMGTYLYLATSLFTRDKLAYIFDANAASVKALSEQTRTRLEVLRESLSVFAREAMRASKRRNKPTPITGEAIFAQKPNLLRVEILGPSVTGKYTPRVALINDRALDQSSLGPADLDYMRDTYPIPIEAVLAQPDEIMLRNSSLPPEAAVLTMAFAVVSDEESLVVLADLRHDQLLSIFTASSLQQRHSYLVDENGVVLADAEAVKVIDHADLSEHPLVHAALTGKVEQEVRELTGPDGAVIIGGYGKVGIGRLSVLTEVPKSQALQTGRELIERSVLFAIGILLLSFMISVFFSRLLTAPIRRLHAATEVVGRGDFDVKVDVSSRDEIGDLADAFGTMAESLKQTQTQLIQSEKMAAFGQLGAGITHEVKNPMTGIVAFAQIGRTRAHDTEKVKELFKMIEEQAVRCTDILVNFLKFARQQERSTKVIDLNEAVRESVKIFGHQLFMNKVKTELDLSDGKLNILGNTGELQQVLLNLAMNAMHALMPKGGKVILRTYAKGDDAVLEVQDNGPGIPEDVQRKMFEPFFTTKPPGEGTGLGLAISFGIIRDHDGTISADSTLGEGTTFRIVIPLARGTVSDARGDAEQRAEETPPQLLKSAER